MKNPGFLTALWLLVLGLSLGTQAGCNIIAPQVVFKFVGAGIPDTAVAGSIAGEVFRILNLSTLILLLALVPSGLGLVRTGLLPPRAPIGIALLLVCLALLLVEVAWITPEIHRLRAELSGLYGNVSLAPREDPLRARFGMLHGLSMVRALVQLILGCIAFVQVAAGLRRA